MKLHSLPQTATDSETVTVNRLQLQESIAGLLKQLPELISSGANEVPLMVRAAAPMLTMMLNSEIVQSSIASGEVTDYLWHELQACEAK